MLRYKGKKKDPYDNIKYGSTQKEELIPLEYEEEKSYPLKVELIGITYPDADYYIERKHSDYYVFEYVISGEGYVEFGGNKIPVKKGDFYMLKQGSAHSYGASKSNPYKKVWVNFFCSFMEGLLLELGLFDKTVIHAPESEKYFKEMLLYAQNPPQDDKDFIEFNAIIFKLLLELSQKIRNQKKTNALAEKIKTLLDASVFRRVTLDDLGRELNLSKTSLCREFKKWYGVSPYGYLLEKRISVAKEMLKNTDKKIKEISEKLCFFDEYNFSNAFKKKEGCSPLAWRKRFKESESESKNRRQDFSC